MEQRGTEDMSQQDHTRRRLKPPENTLQPQLQPPQQQVQPPPPQQPQKCPRCESVNTKFCYYNNYSLSQPRYFCKTCRRYWTQGGTLRNVPVGGGCRKGKRAKPSTSSSSGENSRSLPLPPVSEGHTLTVLPMTLGNNLGLPPINLTATPNYYTGGGGFLSSLAAMQSLSRPQGFNQQANNPSAANNFGLLQGLNFHSFRPQIHQESEMYQMGNRDKNIEEVEGGLYPSHHQNFVQPNRPLGSWTQSFINNVSAAPNSSNLWNNSNSTSGSSLNPNQWPHDLP